MSLKHPDIRMPPPLIHLGGLGVGYGLDQALDWRFAVPGWLQTMVAIVAVFAALLALTAVVWLVRHRTTFLPHRAASHLISSGPFAVSRNPIYLAFALLHLACGVALGSPGILLLLIPVVQVMDRHVIAAEEVFHAQAFGEQWLRYQSRVRRWLGRRHPA